MTLPRKRFLGKTYLVQVCNITEEYLVPHEGSWFAFKLPPTTRIRTANRLLREALGEYPYARLVTREDYRRED